MQTKQPSPSQPSSQTSQVTEHPRSSSCQNASQDLICDFSSMFKRKGSFSNKPPRINNKVVQQSKSPNWLLQIPTKLDFSIEDMNRRRVMDQKRWMAITKTKAVHNQQQGVKIIAAISSIFNYLTNQQSNQMNVDRLLEIIKSDVSFQDILNISEWQRYELIEKVIIGMNKHLNPKFSCKISHKISQPDPNPQQKTALLSGLQTEGKTGYIYLAYKDVFCPIGFDITPLKQIQAYQRLQKIKQQDTELWIINSSLGCNQPTFVIKRWADIQTDLKTEWPNYIDIKEAKLGVRVRPEVEQERIENQAQQKNEQKQESINNQPDTTNNDTKLVQENNKQIEIGKIESKYVGGSNCIIQISIKKQQ